MDLKSRGLNIKVAPLVGYPALKLAGIGAEVALNNAEVQAEALLALDEKANSDVLMALMDLSIEAEGLGCEIRYSQTESPSVTVHPLSELDEESLGALRWDSWKENSREKVFSDVVAMLKEKSGKPVCAFVASPFTLAGLLMGVENIMTEIALENELLPKLLERCAQVTYEHVASLEAAGADIVCLLDPTAMMLGPGMYEESAAKYAKSVIDRMKIPAVMHICGNTSKILPQMAATGAAVLSIDKAVGLDVAVGLIPEETVIMGNLDPMFCVSAGAEDVGEEAKKMNQLMAGRENFISSTGCDLPIKTPVENIVAFINTFRNNH